MNESFDSCSDFRWWVYWLFATHTYRQQSDETFLLVLSSGIHQLIQPTIDDACWVCRYSSFQETEWKVSAGDVIFEMSTWRRHWPVHSRIARQVCFWLVEKLMKRKCSLIDRSIFSPSLSLFSSLLFPSRLVKCVYIFLSLMSIPHNQCICSFIRQAIVKMKFCCTSANSSKQRVSVFEVAHDRSVQNRLSSRNRWRQVSKHRSTPRRCIRDRMPRSPHRLFLSRTVVSLRPVLRVKHRHCSRNCFSSNASTINIWKHSSSSILDHCDATCIRKRSVVSFRTSRKWVHH